MIRRILGRLRDRLLRRERRPWLAEKLADPDRSSLDRSWDDIKHTMPGYAGELSDRRRRRDDRH